MQHSSTFSSRLALLSTGHECRWRLSVDMANVQYASEGVLLLGSKLRVYSSPQVYI